MTLDSVNNGTLVRAAVRILCGTVHVKSNVCVQHEFRQTSGDNRQRGAAPSGKIIGQSGETGSVQVKARTRRNTVWSPENIQRVRIALERSPRRSVQRRRWEQCLDCHGGHLQDIVLNTCGYFCES
jgi:hypothetical protein